MYILLIFIAFAFTLLVAIIIAGITKPRILVLEESVRIEKPLTVVFPQVSLLRNFVTWSPWSAKDPFMTQEFSGEDGEPGFVYSWRGNRSVGEGKMTIEEVVPGALVVLAIDFGHRGSARSAFVLEDMGDSTKVTWSFESDMGGAVRRGLISRMMAKFIRKDYRSGLNNLKNKLEIQ